MTEGKASGKKTSPHEMDGEKISLPKLKIIGAGVQGIAGFDKKGDFYKIETRKTGDLTPGDLFGINHNIKGVMEYKQFNIYAVKDVKKLPPQQILRTMVKRGYHYIAVIKSKYLGKQPDYAGWNTKKSVECFRQLCVTFEKIYKYGYSHNDFGPHNVVVRNGKYSVIDFGNVTPLGERPTHDLADICITCLFPGIYHLQSNEKLRIRPFNKRSGMILDLAEDLGTKVYSIAFAYAILTDPSSLAKCLGDHLTIEDIEKYIKCPIPNEKAVNILKIAVTEKHDGSNFTILAKKILRILEREDEK